MTHLSRKPIKDFLDAVDLVINSNTFLLHFQLSSGNIKEELSSFIRSDDFFRQITEQDAERRWYNMYNFNYIDDGYTLKPGKLVKKDFDLKFKKKLVGPKEYLAAMLTANYEIGNFISYYGKQKQPEEAIRIVDDFIFDLTAGKDLVYYIIEPDFLARGGEDRQPDFCEIYYFEGLHASDSATLLVSEQNAYLLLTNGIP